MFKILIRHCVLDFSCYETQCRQPHRQPTLPFCQRLYQRFIPRKPFLELVNSTCYFTLFGIFPVKIKFSSIENLFDCPIKLCEFSRQTQSPHYKEFFVKPKVSNIRNFFVKFKVPSTCNFFIKLKVSTRNFSVKI